MSKKSQITEEWRPVKGYEDLYRVSNTGKIKSLDKIVMRDNKPFGKKISRLLPQHQENNGYCRVNLLKEGERKKVFVHRIVASSFISNPEDLPCINHINSIRNDNRVENLEWCSYSYNNQYTHDNGRQPKLKPRNKKYYHIDEQEN